MKSINMSALITIGLILIFLGVMAVILGSIFSVLNQQKSAEEKVNVKGGAIIFLGPIPLAFGTDKESLIIISVLMLVLMLIAYVLFFRWKML